MLSEAWREGLGIMPTDTFSTTGVPLRLNDALDVILQPDALLAEVLAFAGPSGIAKLRNFPLFQRRMSKLTPADLSRAGLCPRSGLGEALSGLAAGLSDQVVFMLRGRLLEPTSPRPDAHAHAHAPDSRANISRGTPVRLSRRDDSEYRLTDLGMLALARYPLVSERALMNIASAIGGRPPRPGGDGSPLLSRAALAVAESPNASERVLGVLYGRVGARCAAEGSGEVDSPYRNDRPGVLKAIAAHGNTSRRMMSSLARSDDVKIRAAVAGNARARGEVLEYLAENESAGTVLVALGRNPSTPQKCLERLAAKGRLEVREAVAENPRAPRDVLRSLSTDESMQVRIAASRNPRLPAEILDQLGRDEHWTVRQNAARHRNAKYHTLLRLAKEDSNYWVRLAAGWNPNLPADEVFTDINDPLQQPVIASISRDSAVLDELARVASNEQVHHNVAHNECVSKVTLSYLANSTTSARTQVLVALNPNTPLAVLKKLVHPESAPHVRAVAVRNPNMTAELMVLLVTKYEDEEMMEALASDKKSNAECLSALFERVASLSDEFYRCHLMECLATNPNTPAKVLAALSVSDFQLVRVSVALHPRLPVYHLAQMTCDDMILRKSTAENLLLQRVADCLSCSILQ